MRNCLYDSHMNMVRSQIKVGCTWGIIAVLGISAVLKTVSLYSPTELHSMPHPLFLVSFGSVMSIVTIVEIGVIGLRFLCREYVFFSASMLVGVNFILYHAVSKQLAILQPCGCLGNLLSASPHLSQYESVVSLLLACALVLLSGIGLIYGASKWNDTRR